jgi:acetyl esterase/lipase
MQTTSQTLPARVTHVYKVVDGREVEADVMGARPGANKPCVVWIHGSGLIFG